MLGLAIEDWRSLARAHSIKLALETHQNLLPVIVQVIAFGVVLAF